MKNTKKNVAIRLVVLIAVSLLLATLVWIFHSFSADTTVALNLFIPNLLGGRYV